MRKVQELLKKPITIKNLEQAIKTVEKNEKKLSEKLKTLKDIVRKKNEMFNEIFASITALEENTNVVIEIERTYNKTNDREVLRTEKYKKARQEIEKLTDFLNANDIDKEGDLAALKEEIVSYKKKVQKIKSDIKEQLLNKETFKKALKDEINKTYFGKKVLLTYEQSINLKELNNRYGKFNSIEDIDSGVKETRKELKNQITSKKLEIKKNEQLNKLIKKTEEYNKNKKNLKRIQKELNQKNENTEIFEEQKKWIESQIEKNLEFIKKHKVTDIEKLKKILQLSNNKIDQISQGIKESKGKLKLLEDIQSEIKDPKLKKSLQKTKSIV